jgi:hypothetical protein
MSVCTRFRVRRHGPGPRNSRLTISALFLAVSGEIDEKQGICARYIHRRR